MSYIPMLVSVFPFFMLLVMMVAMVVTLAKHFRDYVPDPVAIDAAEQARIAYIHECRAQKIARRERLVNRFTGRVATR